MMSRLLERQLKNITPMTNILYQKNYKIVKKVLFTFLSYYSVYRLCAIITFEDVSSDGMRMSTEVANLEELRGEIEELKSLVNTLLNIIIEESDGVQSGTAPIIGSNPKKGYSM